MYAGGMGGGIAATTVSAVALPNTGSNKLLETIVIIALVSGIVTVVVNTARMIAAKTAN